MEHRRRKEARENLVYEMDNVKRIQMEVEEERAIQQKKKDKEKEYFKRMLKENMLNQVKAKEEKEK